MSVYLVRSGFGARLSTDEIEHIDRAKRGICLGNGHVVLVDTDVEKRVHVDPLSLSKKVFPNILVVLNTTSGKLKANYRARFYQSGREIQRCGSGYLATAAVVEYLFGATSAYQIETAWDTIRLETVIPNIMGLDCFEFLFPVDSLNIQDTSLPWHAYVNRGVQHQFSIGGKNDYQVLVLTSEKEVKESQINSRLLRKFVQRSLIITAPCSKHEYDYCIRYFSPRYSQIEDNATGSANAVLAEYWQKKLRKKSVRVQQLSPLGGEYIIRRSGLSQKVCGRSRVVRELTLEDILK